jgi:hypothetical protein
MRMARRLLDVIVATRRNKARTEISSHGSLLER